MYKTCILYKQQEVSKNVSLFFFGPYMMKIHKFTISRELYIILIWHLAELSKQPKDPPFYSCLTQYIHQGPKEMS